MPKVFSKFNSFIPIADDKYLGYNAFKDTFILLDAGGFQQIQPQDNRFIATIQKDDAIFQNLVNGGFIIDDSDDEILEIQKNIKSLDFDDTYAEIRLNPTLDCNFKCWYCYERDMNCFRQRE